MNDLYREFKKGLILKFIKLLLGIYLIALANILMFYSELGLNPWGVFHHGISIRTPLTYGQANQVVGFLIILLCSLYKIYPGFGTLFNMIFCGIFIDMINKTNAFSTPKNLEGKFLLLALGIVTMALGTAIYISVNLGAGPKDGLMLLLCSISKYGISIARITSDLTAVLVGCALGGRVGIGSLIIALMLGPTLKIILKVFHYDAKIELQKNIFDTFKRLRDLKISG